MPRFRTTLVPGKRSPYHTWSFVVIPDDIATSWGGGPAPVRGAIAGHAFRGNASRGEGVLRVPVPAAFRQRARLDRGDTVEVMLEADPAPAVVEIPVELQEVFRRAPDVAALYQRLPPAHRRAWAQYVAEAKRPETRLRRAQQAPKGIRARAFP